MIEKTVKKSSKNRNSVSFICRIFAVYPCLSGFFTAMFKSNWCLLLFMGRSFKKLDIYNKSYLLALEIYKILPTLPSSENNNLVDQLRRCCTSIPLNIAEGSGSHSNKVYLTYLGYAYKSSKELEVLLDLCSDLKYLDMPRKDELLFLLEEVRAKLYRFMQQVEKEIVENKPNFSYFRDKI